MLMRPSSQAKKKESYRCSSEKQRERYSNLIANLYELFFLFETVFIGLIPIRVFVKKYFTETLTSFELVVEEIRQIQHTTSQCLKT